MVRAPVRGANKYAPAPPSPEPIPYIVPYPVYVGGSDYIGAGETFDDGSDAEPYGPMLPQDLAPTQPQIQPQVPPPISPPPIETPPPDPPEKKCQTSAATQPADDGRPSHFLVALKDRSVYKAVAYWIDRGTLHYITPSGSHNQVSLDLVDRLSLSRLNPEYRPAAEAERERPRTAGPGI